MRQLLATALLSLTILGCSSTEEDARLEAEAAGTAITEVVVVENLSAEELLLDLRALLSNPRSPQLGTDPARNALVITGMPSEIDEVRQLLERLDV